MDQNRSAGVRRLRQPGQDPAGAGLNCQSHFKRERAHDLASAGGMRLGSSYPSFVLELRVLAGVARLGKSPIRCHEPRQHWCNQLDRIIDRLVAFAREDLGVDDEVPVNGCW